MSDAPTMNLRPVGPEPGPVPKRRHRWRVALIAALVAFVLAVPAAIFLLLRADNRNGAEPGTAPSSAPATSQTPSAPATKPSATPPAPNGRISLATLQNSTLGIPPWPSDHVRGHSGPMRFHNGRVSVPYREAPAGQPPYGEEIVLVSVTYGDVDRDGATESIADVRCLIEGGSSQLVAFDRDRQGRIVTLGTVVATTGEIRDMRPDSARVSSDGVVTVQVGDYQGSGDDQTPVRWQTRGYRWHSGRFEQVSGPTVMPVNPQVTQTRMTAGDLVLGPVVNGYRSGTVTVTLRHDWGVRPNRIQLIFYPPIALERAGTAWPPVTVPAHFGYPTFAVTVTSPPVHGTATYRFAFRRAAEATGGALDIEVQGLSSSGRVLSEAVPWDNGATATIRTVD